jgi:hypothetical protein
LAVERMNNRCLWHADISQRYVGRVTNI